MRGKFSSFLDFSDIRLVGSFSFSVEILRLKIADRASSPSGCAFESPIIVQTSDGDDDDVDSEFWMMPRWVRYFVRPAFADISAMEWNFSFELTLDPSRPIITNCDEMNAINVQLCNFLRCREIFSSSLAHIKCSNWVAVKRAVVVCLEWNSFDRDHNFSRRRKKMIVEI